MPDDPEARSAAADPIDAADRDSHDEDGDADDAGERRHDPTNGDLARLFHEIGDMLEVKGEIAFKTIAYHRAADAIGRSPVDLAAAYRSGKPPKIPGVGQAISDKIAELVATGHMAYYERLRAEIPPSLVELLAIPGLGPKTVRLVYEELHVETLEDLRQAAEAGTLRGLKGISAKTEQQILAGIEALESRPARRLLLPKAEELINTIVAGLDGAPGLRSIEPAGSFRRRRETIGDLDLLAETDDAAAPHGAVREPRRRRRGDRAGDAQVGGPAVPRAAGRPDGDAARRGRHVPDPLHRLEGAQREAPGDRPRQGLVV